MKFRDYYEILGVPRTATAEDIKKAYRRLARKYHPDVSKEADAEARFKEMKEAYSVLKDPEKRKAYDRFGADWKTGQEFRPPPDWERQTGFRHANMGGAGDHQGFSDFFETLFGGGRAGPGAFREGFGGSSKGEDVNARIAIPLEDAFHGATRQLSIEVPELDDQGRYRHRKRTLSVKIPKGIVAGQRIRLADQGGPGIGAGGRSGDLYLQVDYEPHPVFETQERDVIVKLPITPAEAALGRTVQAPTLGGTVDLKIPPGSSSGKRLRLKGRGLPGNPPGDQYVDLKIVLPARIDDKARLLYEQLEKAERFNPRASLVT